MADLLVFEMWISSRMRFLQDIWRPYVIGKCGMGQLFEGTW
jgi:hypothetical protein